MIQNLDLIIKQIFKTKNFVLVRYITVVLLIAKQKTKDKSLI